MTNRYAQSGPGKTLMGREDSEWPTRVQTSSLPVSVEPPRAAWASSQSAAACIPLSPQLPRPATRPPFSIDMGSPKDLAAADLAGSGQISRPLDSRLVSGRTAAGVGPGGLFAVGNRPGRAATSAGTRPSLARSGFCGCAAGMVREAGTVACRSSHPASRCAERDHARHRPCDGRRRHQAEATVGRGRGEAAWPAMRGATTTTTCSAAG
jgi:hypothetical protein